MDAQYTIEAEATSAAYDNVISTAQSINQATSTQRAIEAATATAQAIASATAQAIAEATAQAIVDATATAEAEAAAARGPSLDQFINQVKNGNSGQVVGVYVDGLMALRVVSQSGNPAYINSSWGTATYMYQVKQYTGNDGVGAHNNFSGASFFGLYSGQDVYLIYGNGSYRDFSVSSIKRYQALSPNSPTSNFVDQSSGQTLSATNLFYAIHRGSVRLTFQTCIYRDGEPSWGRYFVIANE